MSLEIFITTELSHTKPEMLIAPEICIQQKSTNKLEALNSAREISQQQKFASKTSNIQKTGNFKITTPETNNNTLHQ